MTENMTTRSLNKKGRSYAGILGFRIDLFLENTMNSTQDMDKKISMMQESMLNMHEQMHKIMDAKNPQERAQLMQAHREKLQQHMQAMKESGMMGGDAKSGMSMAAGQQQKVS